MKTNNHLKQLLCVVFNLLVALPLIAQTSGRIPLSSPLWAIGNESITKVVNKTNSKASASSVSLVILQQIGDEANTAASSIVTVAEINTITPAVTGAILDNEAAYQAYIDANELPPLEFVASRPFSSPATQAEVQKMIIIVNAFEASKSVLDQIGIEANSPTVATLTISQIGCVIPTVRGVVFGFEVNYQNYIDLNYIDINQAGFSMPATQTEIQAMVDELNLVTITTLSSQGDGMLTQDQLTNAGIIQEDLTRKELDSIAKAVDGTDSALTTIEELQVIVDAALATLGTLDYSLETFKMYPNPATSKVVVDLDLEKVSIYNIQGKKVLETSNNTFDVSNFEAGFYVVKIKTNNAINIRRLIKK